MEACQELFRLADELQGLSEASSTEGVRGSIDALIKAANDVGKAFSGSWLGYHSRTYYDGLQPPPPGAHFSQEWGLDGDSWLGFGSTGDWREYNADQVKSHILNKANVSSLENIELSVSSIDDRFSTRKADLVSIFMSENPSGKDAFISKMLDDANGTELISSSDIVRELQPKGSFITRDTTALGQGSQVPPHISILASALALNHSFGACKKLSDIARQAASHLERKSKGKIVSMRVGTNVFIGHGRSSSWRELKDFVQDRLRLPWDEFNRVPVAGVTNITRLSEMLDAAAIAFLVMTAEDEAADGSMHARMNVIHEAGLFQGRLGFTRAIVLLEDGCQEFSNIAGLGQIRFPKGNIGAAFEDVRLVLEREKILGGE